MPLYANSHSMQSASGKQTIYAREESRAIIKRACNANEHDALIFVGTGATSAVNLLINKLRIKQKSEAFARGDSSTKTEQVESSHFCKRNRWNSFDCTICKVILPSVGAYEKHAKTQLHLRAVEVEVTRK